MQAPPPDDDPAPMVADGPDPRPRPRPRHRARQALIAAASVAGVAVLLLVAYLATLWVTTPDLDALRAAQQAKPSVMVAADGTVLTTFRRVQHEPVPLERIAPAVVDALIATEDRRFHDHAGIDVRRTVSALWHSATGRTQGGSTITQQLARNLFPKEIGRARNADRKVREMITALRIERVWSKRRILETYLNTAPFLYNVAGIEMAARTYFDKPAAELDTLESATLVGMLKGTQYYNPVRYPERAQKRRNVVLAQMVKRHNLREADYRSLAAQPLQLQFRKPEDEAGPAPHFTAHVRKLLVDWADENDHDLYADGLVIETTLDTRLQDAATRAVERQARALQQVADVEWARPGLSVSHSVEAYASQRAKVEPFRHFWQAHKDLLGDFIREAPEYRKLRQGGARDDVAVRRLIADTSFMARLRNEKTRLEAGFAAIDPDTGDMKAWVGSRDFDVDQFDHVAQAQRQPGSTFKPFVYGAALEAGIGPDRVYVDGPVEVPLSDGTVWRPTDMSGFSGRSMTLRDGLALSKNTITAQVSQEVGIANIARLAQAAGVDQSKLDSVPSLALGTSPVTLLEMVSGYATIANTGDYRKPVLVRRIRDRDGRVIAEFAATTARRALSADSARDLIDMMRGAVTRGTGTLVKTRFAITADVAGKTGTTQNNTDGWFILMHPRLVAGAWVGFNDQRVTMRSDHWGQGGSNAILLVGDFFREALKADLVDAKAKFPPPAHPSPPPAPPASDTWPGGVEAEIDTDPPAAGEALPSRPPIELIIERDANGNPVIGDRRGVDALLRHAPPAPRRVEDLPPSPDTAPPSSR